MRTNVLLPLLAFLCGAVQTYAENWMQRLPDNVYVSRLSIPGAHDTATGSGWADGMGDLGDAFARTQDLSLAQLWSVGVRAFDLRPCVYGEYMNINHGIVPTALHFDEALRLLCDSLRANPSEFAIVHMLHESDGDQVENAYNQRIQELLQQEEWQDCLINFKADLRVGDMRGKLLIISRDKYATYPTTGGFFENWTGDIAWGKQLSVRITGQKGITAKTCVQDYSDSHGEGGVEKKVDAVNKMLDYSTRYNTTSASTIRWVFNFASAYSLVESLFGYEISTSDGYRDNATHTHSAIIDFLDQHTAGPTGVVLMDYAGVDQSGDYHVRGKELVDCLIDNNFRYLETITNGVSASESSGMTDQQRTVLTIDGKQVKTQREHRLYLEKNTDGTTRKIVK